jgi:hypothetical protein
MNLLSALQQEDALTENGMMTNSSSLNNSLDLFFRIGALRAAEHQDIVRQFSLAFLESPQDAMRILFWARDVRGGAGERRLFRICISYLAENHPEILIKNLHLIPEYGRWDDLLALEGTNVENHAFGLISVALSNCDRLCAKWMPRKGPMANALRKNFGLTPKEYRKLLVGSTEVIEQKMCSGKFDEIDYSRVPSVAAARYQMSFYRNDNDRYRAYLIELQKPSEERTVKINASAVYPYDVVKSLNRGVWEVANEQWNALPNYLEGSSEMILPVVDVSGSMSTSVNRSGSLSCMDVAVSLGLYISERNEGQFKDHFITFSETPELQKLAGSLKERYEQLRTADWGMSTKLVSVFDHILKQASKHSEPQSDMPSKILILSDMEFNQAIDEGESVSAINAIRSRYEEAGYKTPDVIFWNIQSRGSRNIPVRFDENGTALISGFSPSIMKSLLGGKNITPVDIMYETINSQRYEAVKI